MESSNNSTAIVITGILSLAGVVIAAMILGGGEDRAMARSISATQTAEAKNEVAVVDAQATLNAKSTQDAGQINQQATFEAQAAEIARSTVDAYATISAMAAVNAQQTIDAQNNLHSDATPTELESTDSSFSLEFISIPINSKDGRTWIAPTEGTYSFEFISGAYSGWPIDTTACNTDGCWSSRVHAYIGCEVNYAIPEGSTEMIPRNEDFAFGSRGFWEYHQDFASAQQYGQELAPIVYSLDSDTCVRFVAIDKFDPNTGSNSYGDNRGEPIQIAVSKK
ncbi:MAG: hypothetical protein AAF902_06005 [Chloroflexota bacterium]